MNCERARQVEMDEELKPLLLRELLRHQDECAECRAFADERARLLQLLDGWQLEPGFGAGFQRRLEQRIERLERQELTAGAGIWAGLGEAARRWVWPLRAPLAGAALAVALLLSSGTLFRGARPAPAPATTTVAQSDSMMRDLQALDRDGDLLENFDFLSAQSTTGDSSAKAAPNSERD